MIESPKGEMDKPRTAIGARLTAKQDDVLCVDVVYRKGDWWQTAWAEAAKLRRDNPEADVEVERVYE